MALKQLISNFDFSVITHEQLEKVCGEALRESIEGRKCLQYSGSWEFTNRGRSVEIIVRGFGKVTVGKVDSARCVVFPAIARNGELDFFQCDRFAA